MRAIVGTALCAVWLVLAVGCGADGGGGDEEAITETARGLYAIDHGGIDPSGNELRPYLVAFRRLQAVCEGSPDELASSVAQVSSQASDGSGTDVTNLEVLQAAAAAAGGEKQDCAGFFVGLEARLEGAAG